MARLPATRGRWSRWRPYVFTLTPFFVTLTIAAIQGVLYHSGCGLVRTVLLMTGGEVHGARCDSIPIGADLPSLLLGCTASVAAWLYWQSEARWARIADDLAETGVLAADCARIFVPATAAERRLEWLVKSAPGKTMIGVVVAAGGVAFYAITYHGGYLFHDYAASQHLSAGAWRGLRSSWWANWHSRPILAALWVTVGGAGVYAAILDMTGFVLRTYTIRRLVMSDSWRFVPSRARVRHPWEPLMRLANTRVWGLVTFMVTLAVLIYVARAQHAGGPKNIVLATLAVVVLLATMVPLRAYYQAVLSAHEQTILRESQALVQLDSDGELNDYPLKTYVLLRRAELFLLGVPPSISALAKVGRAAAVLVAAAGFVASVYQVSVG